MSYGLPATRAKLRAAAQKVRRKIADGTAEPRGFDKPLAILYTNIN